MAKSAQKAAKTVHQESIKTIVMLKDAIERQEECHGSVCDTCLQGQPGVARPSEARTKNIGRKERQKSQRKHVDR